jgi:hypothetical protein
MKDNFAWRNPAPDSAGPGPAPGTTHTMTISAADRFPGLMKDDLREELRKLVEPYLRGSQWQHGFDHIIADTILHIIARERDAAIAAARPVIEREATAAIVANYRENGPVSCGCCDDSAAEWIARIERGEHKPLDT